MSDNRKFKKETVKKLEHLRNKNPKLKDMVLGEADIMDRIKSGKGLPPLERVMNEG